MDADVFLSGAVAMVNRNFAIMKWCAKLKPRYPSHGKSTQSSSLNSELVEPPFWNEPQVSQSRELPYWDHMTSHAKQQSKLLINNSYFYHNRFRLNPKNVHMNVCNMEKNKDEKELNRRQTNSFSVKRHLLVIYIYIYIYTDVLFIYFCICFLF